MAATVDLMGFKGLSLRVEIDEMDRKVREERNLKAFRENYSNFFRREVEKRNLLPLIAIINQYYDPTKRVTLPFAEESGFDIEALKVRMTPEYIESLNALFFFVLENLDGNPEVAQNQLNILKEVLIDLQKELGVFCSSINAQILNQINIIERVLEFTIEIESLKKVGTLEEELSKRLQGTTTDLDVRFKELQQARKYLTTGSPEPEASNPFIFICAVAAFAKSENLLRFGRVAYSLYEMEILISQLSDHPPCSEHYHSIVLALSQNLQNFNDQFSKESVDREQLLKATVELIEGFKKRNAEAITKAMTELPRKLKSRDFFWVVLNATRNLLIVHKPRPEVTRVVGAKKVESSSSSSTMQVNVRDVVTCVQELGITSPEKAMPSYHETVVSFRCHLESINTPKKIDAAVRGVLEEHFDTSFTFSSFLIWLRNHSEVFNSALEAYRLAIGEVTTFVNRIFSMQLKKLPPIHMKSHSSCVSPPEAHSTIASFYASYQDQLHKIQAATIFFDVDILDGSKILSAQPTQPLYCIARPQSKSHVPLAMDHLQEELRIPYLAQYLGLGNVHASYKATVIYQKSLDKRSPASPGEFFRPWTFPVIQFETTFTFVIGAKTYPLFTSTDVGTCADPFVMQHHKPIPGLEAYAIADAWNRREPGKLTWHTHGGKTLENLKNGIFKVAIDMRHSASAEILEGVTAPKAREAFAKVHRAKGVISLFCQATEWESAAKLVHVLWDETSLISHFKALRQGGMEQMGFPAVSSRGLDSLQSEFASLRTGVAVVPRPAAVVDRNCLDLAHAALTKERQMRFNVQVKRFQADGNAYFFTVKVFITLQEEFRKRSTSTEREFAAQLQRKDATIVRLEEELLKERIAGERQADELSETALKVQELQSLLSQSQAETEKARREMQQIRDESVAAMAQLTSDLVHQTQLKDKAKAEAEKAKKEPAELHMKKAEGDGDDDWVKVPTSS